MKKNEDKVTTSYTTESTSQQSAEINRVVFYETENTRRILQSKIVKNPKDHEAALHITIIHEKKGRDGFTSDKATNLTKLHAGEWVSCDLDSSSTLMLHQELLRQYALAGQIGIDCGKNNYLVVKLNESANLSVDDKDALSNLLKRFHHSPEFAENLSKLSPDLIENAHRYQVLEKMRAGVARFKIMLVEPCSEQDWQNFFKEHNWILGGVHDFQYLSEIADQPVFSGPNFEGSGARRGDFFVSTVGSARFTAIVEIKKANTDILHPRQYRQTYAPSDELNGGLAQLRDYLKRWQLEGSRSDDNRELLEDHGIYTVQPLGILIIGNLDQIKECRKRREAFELFRRNQKDIHIITFDEVYARAVHLLGNDSE